MKKHTTDYNVERIRFRPRYWSEQIHTFIFTYFNNKKNCNVLAENDEAKQCACETMSPNVDDNSDDSSVELCGRKHTLIRI